MRAVQQLDGAHGHAGRLHVDQQEADAGLGLALVAGAHQAEDPFAVLAQCGPGLLAVDDVFVAHAFGAGLDAGEVRARTRFGIALAPPDFAAGDAGQKAPVLLRCAIGHDDRRHHHGAEGHDARRAGECAFFLEQMLLYGAPAGAAEFLGPAVAEPAFFAQNLGPALHVVARQVQIVAHLVRNILGQICPHPAADLFAKSLFFRGECQVHALSPANAGDL